MSNSTAPASGTAHASGSEHLAARGARSDDHALPRLLVDSAAAMANSIQTVGSGTFEGAIKRAPSGMKDIARALRDLARSPT